MKQTSGILLLVFLAGLLPTNSVSALSCLDPASSIEYYVSEEQNTIFTAVAGNTVEHITQKASTEGDPNRQYNAGYVGQYVSVTDVHKGNVESEKWIYYSVNPTWGYMCTSQPPEVGTTNVYVVRNDNGNFDLPSVVQVFSVDSEYAKTILTALEESETSGNLQEKSAENWNEDLGGVLREMLTILRIKLAEWRFWTAQ